MSKVCLICGKSLKPEGPSLYHEGCLREFFGSSLIPDFSKIEEEVLSLAERNLFSGLSVPGVQKKLSFEALSVKRRRKTINKESFIIKLGEERYPHLPKYEELAMLMADSSFIQTVPHALFPTGSGYAYITKRIDRVEGKRLPMEDFCQLCEKLTEYKYDSSYEYCHKKALAYSSNKKLDEIRFFNLILFSYLIGNTDLHLKNFSLIDFGKGYVLSPAYDLIPSEVIASQKEMALSLNGKRKNLTFNDFLAFGKYMGFKDSLSKNLIIKMLGNKGKWLRAIGDSLLDEDEKRAYADFIERRVGEFSPHAI